MATAVELPQLGNTVEECLIARWFKRKGDLVAAGEVIAEIETDKTTFEITASVEGTLLEIYFEEGALAPVFARLCMIGDASETIAAPVAPAAPAAPVAPVAPVLSPRAQKFAAEHNFHPSSVVGSGPGGRVLEADLRKHYKPASFGTRSIIARRMRESLASTAQYTLHASAGAVGLLSVRARMKAARRDISINDLVAFCCVRALIDIPALNAEYIDGRVVVHNDVHLGFACDTPRGLLVPVIHNAHTMTLDTLATRAKELGDLAVAGRIAPSDLSGATFTISNLGGLGIESFTPVINPPQVAILGIGAIQLKPVRVDGRVDFIDAIGLSLTCDHQVIDGAPGARFLQVVKEKIETVEKFDVRSS